MKTILRKILGTEPTEPSSTITDKKPASDKKQHVWSTELDNLPEYVSRRNMTNSLIDSLHWESQEENKLHTLVWGNGIVAVVKRTDFGYVWQADLELELPNSVAEWLTQTLPTSSSLSDTKVHVYQKIANKIVEWNMSRDHPRYDTEYWACHFEIGRTQEWHDLLKQQAEEQATRVKEKYSAIRQRREASKRRCAC
jgi:hypothetical protein